MKNSHDKDDSLVTLFADKNKETMTDKINISQTLKQKVVKHRNTCYKKTTGVNVTCCSSVMDLI